MKEIHYIPSEQEPLIMVKYSNNMIETLTSNRFNPGPGSYAY